MKNKSNEWVSISDLMAGVVAVIVLLLVCSILHSRYLQMKMNQEKTAIEEQAKREKELLEIEKQQIELAKKSTLDNILQKMKDSLKSNDNNELVVFDFSGGKIILKDNVFSRGSACITPEARQALTIIIPKIKEFVSYSSETQVFIEGHTDNLPVSKPVTNYEKFCSVYDDNYTLSAARAREARNLIIKELSNIDAQRIIVAGFGESNPLIKENPSDEKNRRVEVRFLYSPL